MDDLISRQAAIDAVNAHYDDEYFNFYTVMDILKQLPSAQPEPERTMEEFMYGQDMGNPEDGSL